MIRTKYIQSPSNPIGYWLQIPDSIKNTYPCIIDLHGVGGLGPGNFGSLDMLITGITSAPTQGEWAETPQTLQVSANLYGALLIAPQVSSNWTEKMINDIIDIAIIKHNADPSNIFLTGFSMGGGGVSLFITSLSSKRIKAAISCAGLNWGTDWKKATIPVWFFHCYDDLRVSVSNTNAAVNSMKAAGLNPKVTIFPNGGHSYKTAYSSKETFDWLLSGSSVVLPPPPPINILKANVGADLTISTSTFELDGSASVGYSEGGWLVMDGPGKFWGVSATGGWSGIKQKIKSLEEGVYTFKHYVFDNNGGKSEAELKLTVKFPVIEPIPKEVLLTLPVPTGSKSVVIFIDKSFEFKY